MNDTIHFSVFQMISFATFASLFIYMGTAWLNWFIKECKPKKISKWARIGRI